MGVDLSQVSAFGWVQIASIGTAIGLVIAYFASRQYIKQTHETLRDTIATQEKNLEAKDELAKSLASTYTETIAKIEDKLAVMTKERDAYRADLHATRDPMNAMKLRIAELELRPNLTQVLEKEEEWHTKREEFYSTMSKTQEQILTLMKERDSGLLQMMQKVLDQLTENAKVFMEAQKTARPVEIINDESKRVPVDPDGKAV